MKPSNLPSLPCLLPRTTIHFVEPFLWISISKYLGKDHFLVSSPIRLSKRSTGMRKSNGSGGDRLKTLSFFIRIPSFFTKSVLQPLLLQQISTPIFLELRVHSLSQSTQGYQKIFIVNLKICHRFEITLKNR